MKTLFIPLIALGFGTAAMAQAPDGTPKSYPSCSKSVTDECMGSAHATHAAKPVKHRHHVAHATKPAMKKTEAKTS